VDPVHVEVRDESPLHAGHAAAGGGGHYAVRIVSAAFEGLSPVERHRLIHSALGEAVKTTIHALAIGAWTPEEWRSGASTTAVSTVPRPAPRSTPRQGD